MHKKNSASRGGAFLVCAVMLPFFASASWAGTSSCSTPGSSSGCANIDQGFSALTTIVPASNDTSSGAAANNDILNILALTGAPMTSFDSSPVSNPAPVTLGTGPVTAPLGSLGATSPILTPVSMPNNTLLNPINDNLLNVTNNQNDGSSPITSLLLLTGASLSSIEGSPNDPPPPGNLDPGTTPEPSTIVLAGSVLMLLAGLRIVRGKRVGAAEFPRT